MTRYKGFCEDMLEEHGEQAFRNPLNEASDASDSSMRDAVDEAAKKMRFRDEQSTLTYAEYLNQLCGQLRNGK